MLTAFFVRLLFGGDSAELPIVLDVLVMASGLLVVAHALTGIWRDRRDPDRP